MNKFTNLNVGTIAKSNIPILATGKLVGTYLLISDFYSWLKMFSKCQPRSVKNEQPLYL